MWSGFVSFGLINIPMKLYSASEDHSLHFSLYHEKDNAPIRYARICTQEGVEIPWEEVVKGYERAEGDVVILTSEDFAAAKVQHEKVIEILTFVDLAEIPPFFYEKPYYLEPSKGGSKSYFLLLAALRESKKVGVARFLLHNIEHYAVLLPTEHVLILNQIRMLEDIRDYTSLNLEPVRVTDQEVNLAVELIDRLTGHFEPQAFHDVYKERLAEIVEEKARGKKVKVGKRKEVASTKVVDLMSVLKKSLEKEKRRKKFNLKLTIAQAGSS
jgi:DNA end-binding protein Ku